MEEQSTMKQSNAMRISFFMGVAVFVAALFISSPTPTASSASAMAPVPRIPLAECFVSGRDAFSPHMIMALRRVQQEAGQEHLVVLAYFAFELPCPPDNPNAQCPNPLTSVDSRPRWDYYRALPLGVQGFPTLIWNGTFMQPFFGDPRSPTFSDENVFNSYRETYRQVSRATSPVQIALNGGIVMEAADRYRADVQAVLTATDRVRGRSTIWFALYENNVQARAWTWTGSTFELVPFEFDWVVRKLINSEPLTITQSGQQQMATRSIDLDPAWNRENLGIAVFVQGDTNRGGGSEVIQSASLNFDMP